jgi:hypothetical protein
MSELSDVVQQNVGDFKTSGKSDQLVISGKDVDTLYENITKHFRELNGENLTCFYDFITESDGVVRYIKATIKGKIDNLPDMLNSWDKEGILLDDSIEYPTNQDLVQKRFTPKHSPLTIKINDSTYKISPIDDLTEVGNGYHRSKFMQWLCTNIKENIPSFLKSNLRKLDNAMGGFIQEYKCNIDDLKKNRYSVTITKT